MRLTFFMLFALPMAAWAQPPLTEDDAVRLGLARTERAALERAALDAAEADVRAAGVHPNPTLRYSREQLDGTPDSVEQAWMLEQAFDFSGRRGLHRDAARRRVAAVEAGNARDRQQLAAEIRRGFHAVLHRQAVVDATATWVARFTRVEAVVERLARAGEASGYDRRRLARERQAAQALLATERAALDLEAARLAALTGLAPLPPLAGELLPPPLPPLDASLDGLDRHPQLDALARRAEAADLEARAAARGAIPELTAGVGPKAVESAGVRESGVAFSLSLPLPVFDRQQAGRARAAAEARQVRAEHALLRARAEGELRGRHGQAERLRATAIDYRRDAAAATPELLRVAESAYQGGESSLLELLDAYRGALDAETTVLELEWRARDARIDYDLLAAPPADAAPSAAALSAPREPSIPGSPDR